MIGYRSEIWGKASAALACVAFLVLPSFGQDSASSLPSKSAATVTVPAKMESPLPGQAARASPARSNEKSAATLPLGVDSTGPQSSDGLDKSKAAASQETRAPRTMRFSTLVGDLPKSLRAEKGPYLVTSDIYVPAGKTLSIQAGTVLLFKNFTGLHVQGTLAVLGTTDKPVVFTSENDRRFNPAAGLNPNPYDWNGVFIHDDAIGTDLQNFEIAYSVYGINTLTKFIRITNGVFRDNGRANLTIEGMPQTVTAGPFSYSLSVKNAAVDGVPVKILTDPDAAKRSSLRIGGLTLFLTGCALGAISTIQMNSWQKQMNTIGNDLYSYQRSDFDAAQAGRNKNIALMSVEYSFALIGAAGFSLSFRY
jgi:hypothetical protein